MKRVQFKDLPEKVQGFLLREFFKQNGKYVLATDVIRLDWLHPLPLWSLATDDERLAYAEWMYKIGVRLKDAYDYEEYGLKSRDTIFYLEKDPRSPHDILLTRHEHHTDITIYDSDKNKWAEIIEEPFNLTDTGDFRSEPEKEETFEIPLVERKYTDFIRSFLLTNNKYDSKNLTQEQHEFFVSVVYATLKAVNHFKEEQPEFKAGEIVEVWNTDTEMDLQPAKYRFFADGKHWVETCASDIVVNFKNIRKPDPDAKLKEIAKEIMFKNPIPVDVISDEQYLSYLTIQRLEQMLIEALKKGKSL